MTGDWTPDEVELIVADYFAMLRAELSGEPLNKAAHNQRLRQQIARSRGSIEFKHENISAVLLNLGDFPYIDGYKPRRNYQRLLEQVVLERLAAEPDFFERLADGPVVRPIKPPKTEFADVQQLVEPPPEPVSGPGVYVDEAATHPHSPRLARNTDFVQLDAENRNLGRMGEEWVLEFEARRLTDAHQRPDLANRIVWVSRDEGDGAGFDIRSFDEDATPRLIEVKTTGLAKYHPFYVSPNEVTVSRHQADVYHLYRLFRFGRGPRLYILRGALSSTCRLEAAQYSARFAR
jgi:hypothetical protein